MKKAIAAILVLVQILLLSISCADAADVTKMNMGLFSKGKIYLYRYNLSDTNASHIDFVDSTGHLVWVDFKDMTSESKSYAYDTSNSVFEIANGVRHSSSAGILNRFKIVGNKSGWYQKIRIKLSDYSGKFLSDGRYPFAASNFPFRIYDYKPHKDDAGNTYASTLMIVSGSAINSVEPDENGEVEIWVSRSIGEQTYYCVAVGQEDAKTDSITTVIRNCGYEENVFKKLTVGDANGDGKVNINDVTYIQSVAAGFKSVSENSAADFRMNVNNDKAVDVNDATSVQKYLAEIS